MRVLLALVTAGGPCSLGFGISMIRLVVALRQAPGVDAVVWVAGSLRAAVDKAHADGYDAVVAVAASVSFPAGLVLGALAGDHDFVAGAYPLPVLDWGRVAAWKPDAGGEALRFRGNTYNVDPATCAPPSLGGHLEAREAGLGAVVLKKPAIAALASAPAGDVSDVALCRAWGRGVRVDLGNPCACTGTVEFAGCVGYRAQATQAT